MLISHQWPVITATRKAVSALDIARNNDLDPMLHRLREVLRSDCILAATVSAHGEAQVIGSVGSHQADIVQHVTSLTDLRPCGSSRRRIAGPFASEREASSPDIVLTRVAEADSSVLSIKVPAGLHTTIAIIAVRRTPRTSFSSNDERVLQRYADWVGDYIAMWWKLHEGEQRRIGLERALDQVGLAMIMLDCDGRTVGTNGAAQQLLRAGDGLIAVGATLSAAILEDAVRLHSAIGHALIGPMHDARAPVLTIRRKRRRPLVVAVLRVAADPRPGETAIVLQVIEPDRDHDSAITATCTLFGFTGAEARLAKLLVRGATLAEAAAALRIQMPTARTYLKQAFAKSGTNRQAALVQVLLSSLPYPNAETVLTAV